jgi:hypothetical protein
MKKLVFFSILIISLNIFGQNRRACVGGHFTQPEDCRGDEGNWIDESGYSCVNSVDVQDEGEVCCAPCTEDAMDPGVD